MKKKYSVTKEYTYMPRPRLFYGVIYAITRILYPFFTIEGLNKIDKSKPAIIIANHSQIDGPLAFTLSTKRRFRIWCDGDVCFWRKFPSYAMSNFFYNKKHKGFYRLISYLLTPLAVVIFRGSNVIPVYRDMRQLTTYRKTVESIQAGKIPVIFAEGPQKYNEYLNVLNEGFVNVGKVIGGKLKSNTLFYPAYVCRDLKKIVIGNPVIYDAAIPSNLQREEIIHKLSEGITELASSLPKHKIKNYN